MIILWFVIVVVNGGLFLVSNFYFLTKINHFIKKTGD